MPSEPVRSQSTPPQSPEPADVVIPTPNDLRALAHPLRLRMLGLLRIEGSSTASRLASRLGLNSGATSYHLRQLAGHGFVVDDPEKGSGRERWWRAAHRSTHVPDDDSGESSHRDARQAFSQAVAVSYGGQIQQAVEQQTTLPEQWRGLSSASDWSLRLTPQEARQLHDELQAVVERYRQWYPDRPEAPEGAGLYRVLLNTFPRPVPTTTTDER